VTDAARAADSTLAALFRRAARVYADRTALVGSGVRRTYRELDERSDRLANALAAAGLGHGDRLAVLSVPRPEYAETYVAAAKLGVTVVALNHRLHVDELDHCVRLGAPRLLLCSPDQAQVAARLIGAGPVTAFGDAYEALLAGAPATPVDVDVRGEDIHNILFTSGTTGLPKGAMVSQRAAATRGLRVAQWFGLGPDDGFVGWLPMFHCGGDEPLYATLLSGGKVHTLERADPEAMYAAIEAERLTWTLFLPGVINAFLDHREHSDRDVSTLRFGIGYANMMPHVVQTFTRTFGCGFWDAFGQTETSFVVAYGWVGPGELPSGRKVPTPLMEVRIAGPDGAEQPVGEPGECLVRGPSVMSGYLGDEAATAAVLAGGWLHTGDVLVRHDDGALSFVDRTKYLIKTGGENVYPAEVERAIAAHPAVAEVCVFGVPDPHWGETIKAAVVLAPGAQASAGELSDWCRDRLAGYKRPRYVQFLAEQDLPRSATGKILRHELQALGVDEGQRAG
jgi:fatty-acyl-CoA synthase